MRITVVMEQFMQKMLLLRGEERKAAFQIQPMQPPSQLAQDSSREIRITLESMIMERAQEFDLDCPAYTPQESSRIIRVERARDVELEVMHMFPPMDSQKGKMYAEKERVQRVKVLTGKRGSGRVLLRSYKDKPPVSDSLPKSNDHRNSLDTRDSSYSLDPIIDYQPDSLLECTDSYSDDGDNLHLE